MALGAQPGGIVRIVVAYAARPVAIGSLIGFVVTVVLAFAISAGVPEFDARDPVNYGRRDPDDLACHVRRELLACASCYLGRPARFAAATVRHTLGDYD